ncbi:autotransporter outer membrane beta-barrel domain-containing protein [Pseudomonas sichuanensis]|uniref:autotransporter outer membrane beta-barrel domain-containing protein n=1 Tax=Pseudomonas sichuanensis TaxID=2213015 RepID=UPI00215E367F|nr:autotransporter outer membrane beta-barrel domain-containing protein [Pseudomonas sichuanensis]UVK84403.1 autotransporter outer membrane beta-barrel domain-containing protein [Pseudomonas sichuanensis]
MSNERYAKRVKAGITACWLLLPTTAIAAIVENGDTLTIDSTTAPTFYLVRGQSTLNSQPGAVTESIAITEGSSLDMRGSTVNGGTDYGVMVSESSATINASSISSDFIGLNVSRTPAGTTGSQVSVSNSTIIGAEGGAEVTGLSTLILANTQVTGSDATANGIDLRGGSVMAMAGTVITGGKNGVSISRDSNNVGDFSLALDGASVVGQNGAAIAVVGGVQAKVTLANGSSLSGANDLLLDVSQASGVDMSVRDSDLTGDFQVREGSDATLAFSGGSLTGDVLVEQGSTAAVALSSGAVLTGRLQNVSEVAIASGANWTLVESQQVEDLALDGGIVTFGSASQFYQLDVANLSGNGTFVMDVDWASNQHDVLNVTGTATGSHTLQVAGSGVDPANPQALTLVRTAAGDATFALSGNRPVDVGTYSYQLQSQANGSGGSDWFLDPSSKSLSPSTRSVLALFNTAPTVWYGELTSLRTRMGELRFNGGKAGAWARSYSNKYDVSPLSGLGYSQVQSGFSLGADAPLPWGDGQWLVGVLAGHSRSDLDVSRGTSGSVDSYYAGLYTTWLDSASGYYFDAVLKANRFHNKAKVSMSDDTRAKGDYDNVGLGGSVEFGRHIVLADGWFVEPFGQLSTVVIQGKDYGLDNGMQAEGEQTRSVLGKVGSVVGRNLHLEGGAVLQPYVKAALAHEFAKANRVEVNDNPFNNDLSGSRAEFGAGVAVAFTERFSVHADLDYAKGEHIEQPYGVNLGLRYSW